MRSWACGARARRSYHRRPRRRWWLVAAGLVVAAVALPFAGRAQSKLSNGGFEVPGAESQRNLAYFDHLPRYGAQPFTLLVSAPTSAAAEACLAAVRRESDAIDGRLRFTHCAGRLA